MTRTDIHRPAEFDPTDYRVIDYLDNQRPKPPVTGNADALEAYARWVAAWEARIFEHFPDWRTGGDDHASIFTCNHCGHPGIRYVAVVEHVPSGARLAFGEICAERCELPGRDAFRRKYAYDAAERERRKHEREIELAEFRAGAGDVADFLAGLNDDYGSREPEFLLSLKSQLTRKGTLSEKQVEAARKFLVKRQERTERFAAESAALEGVPPVPEGRFTVEGMIASMKPGTFGLQMLVKLDDGNKVWGPVPEALAGSYGTDPAEVGQRVRFNGTVQRSNKDEHFGFFKNPRKAEVV